MRLTNRYIFEPTTVVDAPWMQERLRYNLHRRTQVLTTSFGGTSPVVFRQNVVRSETECILKVDAPGGLLRLRYERRGEEQRGETRGEIYSVK